MSVITDIRSFREMEADGGRAMSAAWERYSLVLRDLGMNVTWEHKLAFYAGWAREG